MARAFSFEFLIDVMKVRFILDLANNLDNDIIDSWDEAIEYYLNLAQLPKIRDLDSEFFSLLYLISDGDSGIIVDEDYFLETVESEFKKFINNSDIIYDITINSNKDLVGRSKDLGDVLYNFYKNTDVGILYLNEYIHRLIEELVARLWIYSTEEEIYDDLGEYLLGVLRKYGLI